VGVNKSKHLNQKPQKTQWGNRGTGPTLKGKGGGPPRGGGGMGIKGRGGTGAGENRLKGPIRLFGGSRGVVTQTTCQKVWA